MVQKFGKRFQTDLFLALYVPGNSETTRCGLTVSKKVGNSVIRNRVKRHFRESLRIRSSTIQGNWDIVFIAYQNSGIATAKQFHHQIKRFFTFLSRRT